MTSQLNHTHVRAIEVATIEVGNLSLRRAILLYLMYFVVCVGVDVTLLQKIPILVQLGIIYAAPWLLVALHLRRRKSRAKTKNAGSVPVELVAAAKVPRTEGDNKRVAAGGIEPSIEYNPPHSRGSSETRERVPEFGGAPSKPKNVSGTNKDAGWISKDSTATVGGRKIGGMVYVGTPPRISLQGYQQKLKAHIDPSLSVAMHGSDKQGSGMPYWPSYSEIPPVCRATYLDWLAAGRTDASVNPGYMFLYFYGLERRFLVDDSSDEEKQDILGEVLRLKTLFKENHSAQRYLGAFIDLAKIILDHPDSRKPILKNWGWEMPLSLKFALGQMSAYEQPLSAEWVLSWFLCHPDRRLRTPAQRCEAEFFKLFSLKFKRQLPDGMKLPKPKRQLILNYRAASGEFEESLPLFAGDQPTPDVTNLRKPIEIAQAIADASMDELEKFSRFLGRKPAGRDSLEGHALLPLELRQHIPSAALDELKSWVASLVRNGGSIRCEDLINRLEGSKTEKATKKQMAEAADTLGRIGFGIAPDARFSIRAAKPNEDISVFELANAEESLEGASESYKSAMLEIAIAALVIHADERVDQTEAAFLRRKVAEFRGLVANEQKQLVANLEWHLAVPPNFTSVRGLLEKAPEQQHHPLRQAIVSAARADGVLQSEEVESIAKIYRALGIDPRQAYSDMHAGQLNDGPITVKSAESGIPGEAIPDPRDNVRVTLRADRIAEIQTDTAKVAELLGDIFSEPERSVMPEPIRNEVPVSFKGLDRKYVPVIQRIIQKNHWLPSEFQDLVGAQGLMTAGTIETLNEWSYRLFDEAILDEYDGYEVSPNIASLLKAELAERMIQ